MFSIIAALCEQLKISKHAGKKLPNERKIKLYLLNLSCTPGVQKVLKYENACQTYRSTYI